VSETNKDPVLGGIDIEMNEFLNNLVDDDIFMFDRDVGESSEDD